MKTTINEFCASLRKMKHETRKSGENGNWNLL